MVFNLSVPAVGNNVDACVIRCGERAFTGPKKELKTIISDVSVYVALGELKGGIDPAGADEHWKTASKALARIRDSFSARHLTPLTFFIGAAIERKMASEIWKELEQGTLGNAANLTDTRHLSFLCQWLVNL